MLTSIDVNTTFIRHCCTFVVTLKQICVLIGRDKELGFYKTLMSKYRYIFYRSLTLTYVVLLTLTLAYCYKRFLLLLRTKLTHRHQNNVYPRPCDVRVFTGNGHIGWRNPIVVNNYMFCHFCISRPYTNEG